MIQNLIFDTKPGLLVHEWTKRFLHGPPDIPSSVTTPPESWIDHQIAQSGPGEALVPADDPYVGNFRSCFETLAHRRSERIYGDAPFTRDDLARVLALAFPQTAPATASLTPHTRMHSWHSHRTSCKLLPIITNVEGIDPGGYLYDERDHSLRCLRAEPPQALLQRACFQAEFHVAPVLFAVVGSLADVQQRYGDRGYRYLLLETGLMIQRLYLAVSYLGLSGCATGSIVHVSFNTWLGLDGYTGTMLMGFTAGPALAQEHHDG